MRPTTPMQRHREMTVPGDVIGQATWSSLWLMLADVRGRFYFLNASGAVWIKVPLSHRSENVKDRG